MQQGKNENEVKNLMTVLERIQQVNIKIGSAIGIVQGKMGSTRARKLNIKSTQV